MSIFKAYDVRGIYNENLTEKEAYKIGFYLAKYLNLTSVKIGHDARISSESLTKYLIKGFIDANCNVIFLGKISTPMFYFSLFEGSSSGVMVTASHNPKEYNGFKIIQNGLSFDSRNGLYNVEKLVTEDLLELDDNLDSLHLEKVSLTDFLIKNEIEVLEIKEKYILFLENLFNLIFSKEDLEILKNLNFAIDFSSGVSSCALVDFFDRVGLNFKTYNEICDGNFPNHSPDPLKAENYLKEIENKTDFTFVFDGDGDRIVLFDEKNEVVLPDYMISMLIEYFSSQKNESNLEFVCDLRASKYLTEFAKENNINLKLMKVGRAFYFDYMKEKDCEFGAELSGHMFFRKFNYLDNPEIALFYLLKIIVLELKKSASISSNLNSNFICSDLVKKYKKYYKLKEESIKVKDLSLSLNLVFEKYEKNLVMDIDGFSFETQDFWFNIRKSNTESVLKINFEGVSKKIVDKEMSILKQFILDKDLQ